MPQISIVIPVYKALECIVELHRRLTDAVSAITPDYELVWVEDCGKDGSWERMQQLAAGDRKLKAIKMSRNFGQHYAIAAGLDAADGEWIVVMDCDLQDKPEEIGKLFTKAQEGYDVVLARRHLRIDSFYRRFVSWLFIQIYNYLGDIKVDNSISNFSISSRRVIDSVRRFRERNRSFPIFRDAVGFKTTTVDVEHAARFAGKSSYSFLKLLDFAIQCIVAQSSKPLRLSIKIGFSLALASGFYAALLIFRYFYFGTALQGWTSTMVAVSFFFGLVLANLGVIGLYLGKIFDEVKGRPLYIVETALNLAPPIPVPATTGAATQRLVKE
ncbi:MAG: glycosyltransferase family 2 protein [Verrucomicrobiaceae bacterium]|nr:glycosyltransferase family 2 protein [Verrucomicrobiaceae bacterium]